MADSHSKEIKGGCPQGVDAICGSVDNALGVVVGIFGGVMPVLFEVATDGNDVVCP